MFISQETSEARQARLLQVIARAHYRELEGAWIFDEFELDQFPQRVSERTVALVRDEEIWSQLIPSNDDTAEQFGVFAFHFEPNLDNSGFVGWLASHLKDKFGSGVFVICGQNSSRGGIFDYWGCPLELRDQMFQEIRRLRTQHHR
jgi:Family of unknown function (DUF6196)